MEEKERQLFLGEIKQHISPDAGDKTPMMRRTKRLFKRTAWIPALGLTAILVSGALLGMFVWELYSIRTEGDITVNGSMDQAALLFYDGHMLTGTSYNITTMDTNTLNPGDNLTYTHMFDNQNGHQFNVTLNLDQMPLEYVDEEDIWYGLEIYAYEHGTTIPLESFTLPPETLYEFDINYRVHPLFKEPGETFPFLLLITVEAYDTTPIGQPDFYSVDNMNVLSADAPGVLGNDINPGSGTMTASLIDDVQHGILSLNDDGSFTYDAEEDYIGEDSFTYQPMIGEVEGYPATVTIDIDHVNVAPIAVDDTYDIYDHEHHVIDVMANDNDPDSGPGSLTITSAVITGSTSHIWINNLGTGIEVWMDASWEITRTITYTVSDGELTDTATLTVNYQQ